MSDRQYNTFLGGLRRLAAGLIVVVLLVLARPTPSWLAVGLVLVVLGEAVRVWAAGHLVKTAELVTSGPYRYTRNPLYLGRFLILTGLVVMVHLPYYGSWIALVIGWTLFFGYYLPRKERVEPARLAGVDGEAFDSYFSSVPALFPSLHPYEQSARLSWSWTRFVRNREHLMVAGLLLAALILVWRMYDAAAG